MLSDNAQKLPSNVQNLLRYFGYVHLPPNLQSISKPFSDTANVIVDNYIEATEADGELNMAELVVGLRKLLEAKDCVVRAHVRPK